MADRDDQSNLPPIPDGGLAESMPDWLRRPPAWRTLPDRDVTLPEPTETAALPEPDDSVIDPRTSLGDDDLPAWLRNLGPGRRRDADYPAQDEPEPDRSASGSLIQAPADVTAGSTPEASRTRFTPMSPPTPVGHAAPPPSTQETALRPQAQPVNASAWQGAWVVALLATLLVAAIAVIIVLVL